MPDQPPAEETAGPRLVELSTVAEQIDAIDNLIARLRKKIEGDPERPQLIKTVRGMGYTFAADAKRLT